MKPSSARGSRQSEPREKKPRRRLSKTRISLSPEFLMWCERNHFKPEAIAPHVLHTAALDFGTRPTIIRSDTPFAAAEIYDLPADGKEAA